MKRIEPYPVAVALSSVFFLLYVVCVALHYAMPEAMESSWPMHHLWEAILPGFTWITALDFLIGSMEIIFLGAYTAYILVPLYNTFNHRFPDSKGEVDMQSIRFLPFALASASFGVISYVLCILFDLVFPQWAMTRLWEVLLPGFRGLSFGSFFIGLAGVIGYGFYVAVVFVPIYSFFSSSRLSQA